MTYRKYPNERTAIKITNEEPYDSNKNEFILLIILNKSLK